MKDRKYKSYLITAGLLMVAYVITHFLGISEGLFKIFIGALIGAEAIYDGSNVIVKKIRTKTGNDKTV